jgi:hypothetical protein
MSDMPFKIAADGATENSGATRQQLERGFIEHPVQEPMWPMGTNANGDEIDRSVEIDSTWKPVGFLTRPNGDER